MKILNVTYIFKKSHKYSFYMSFLVPKIDISYAREITFNQMLKPHYQEPPLAELGSYQISQIRSCELRTVQVAHSMLEIDSPCSKAVFQTFPAVRSDLKVGRLRFRLHAN